MKPRLLATAFLLLPAFTVLAQGTVPAAETVAPPNCPKPLMPSKVRRADDTSEFQEKFDHYRECIKSYVDAQSEASKQHVTAANAAVKELNEFVAQVNASQDNNN